MNLMKLFASSTMSFVLLLGLMTHESAFAKKANKSSRTQYSQTHEEVIANEPALVNRDLQRFVSEIGTRILSQSQSLSDVDVLVLDSGRVDSFYSSSGYIYLTRGLLLLAGDDSHVASILALEVASMEQESVSETERFKRAAQILNAAAYKPSALPEFLSILVRHKHYTENNETAQSVMGQSHHRFKDDDSILSTLRSYASELDSQGASVLSMTPKSNFLMMLNGLAVGQTPGFELKNRGSQLIKEDGFTVFLPDSWTVFRREKIDEIVPIKNTALGTRENDSAMVLRSPLKQAMEIIVFGVDKPDFDRTAEQSLKLHLERISSKSKVSREGIINGENWQGYLIEGRIRVKFKGGREVHKFALGSVSLSFKHMSALVPLANKLVIATTMPMAYIDDYHELDIDAFRNIVSSIRAPQQTSAEPGKAAQHRIKIHEVALGETVESLTVNNSLKDAAQALRVLNGLGPNDQLEVGQRFKLIESRY